MLTGSSIKFRILRFARSVMARGSVLRNASAADIVEALVGLKLTPR